MSHSQKTRCLETYKFVMRNQVSLNDTSKNNGKIYVKNHKTHVTQTRTKIAHNK